MAGQTYLSQLILLYLNEKTPNINAIWIRANLFNLRK